MKNHLARSGPLAPARAGARRRIGRLAAAGLVSSALAGCVPAAMGGLALLGGSGGESRTSAQSGPFAATPHPVQNARPATPGAEELQPVLDRQIEQSCRDRLPEPQPELPAAGCVLRPSCLAGMTAPVTLRVCARAGVTGAI